MSDVKWTDDQLKAISTRNKNLLVSAAAGSGKTALLIERIRRLIAEEGVPVDSLLVLTFTRAAAGEMRERLSRALKKELSEKNHSAAECAALQEQIQRLGSASISTIHAFCGNVVREYHQETDVEPDFRVGDDIRSGLLWDEAVDEVLEAHYAEIPEDGQNDFSRLVDCYSGSRNDDDLRKLIKRYYGFLSTLEDPEKWFEEADARLKMDADSFYASDWWQTIRKDAVEKIDSAEAILTGALEIIAGSEIGKKTQDQLKEDIAGVQGLRNSIQGADFDGLFEAFKGVGKLFGRYKGFKKEDPETSDRIKNLRNEARDILKSLGEIIDENLGECLSDMKECEPVMAELHRITRECGEAFYEKKKANNILDFSDLERLTLKILDNPDIAGDLRRRYAYVFIDEYQDTNEMQEAIIRRILRKDNYFMVGDVKQSIYRFRLADPGIFLSKYHRFSAGEDENSELITLNRNFRSDAGIIDGVNLLFSRIMSEELGEVAYDSRAELHQGAAAEEHPHPVEVHIDAGKGSSEAEREARLIAGKINAIVGRPMYIAKEGTTRPLRYRDIGVFMRNVAGRGEIYAKVLADEGIPTYFDGGSAYYDSREIVVVLNTIRVLDNSRRDIPLMSVMASPIGGFSETEMAEIRVRGNGTERQYPFYRCAERVCREDLTPLGDKLRKFYADLDEWRRRAQTMTADDFLWMIYTETGYYTAVGALPGGQQRQKNLRALLNRAVEYKNATFYGVFRFADYIERGTKLSSDFSPPGILSENDDVVRIMTIHKSKGLEFPVVFIAGTSKRFHSDRSGRLILHRDLGLCPELVRPDDRTVSETLCYKMARERRKIERLSEEMRLLYVAMTRAMERLYIVGCVDGAEDVEKMMQRPCTPYFLKNSNSYLSWILAAVSERDREKIAVEIHVEESEEPARTDDLSEDKAEVPKDEIRRRLDWTYPGAGIDVPGKISVTQIAAIRKSKGEMEETRIVRRQERPSFMLMSAESFSAAEIGTGIHAVMESVDLKKLWAAPESSAETIRQEAEHLADIGVLPEELVRHLDLTVVRDFYASPLGQRLLGSKNVLREKTFTLTVPAGRITGEWQASNQRVSVQGMIDCCFTEGDSWILLDYKTDHFTGKEERQKLIDRYQIQINFYAEALEKLTGRKVSEKYLCFLSERENAAI